MVKILTREEVIMRSQNIHKNEDNKPLYDYERLVYLGKEKKGINF